MHRLSHALWCCYFFFARLFFSNSLANWPGWEKKKETKRVKEKKSSYIAFRTFRPGWMNLRARRRKCKHKMICKIDAIRYSLTIRTYTQCTQPSSTCNDQWFSLLQLCTRYVAIFCVCLSGKRLLRQWRQRWRRQWWRHRPLAKARNYNRSLKLFFLYKI